MLIVTLTSITEIGFFISSLQLEIKVDTTNIIIDGFIILFSIVYHVFEYSLCAIEQSLQSSLFVCLPIVSSAKIFNLKGSL